jgi:Lrp/AsnC family leucine-responsive transcriptional regulator
MLSLDETDWRILRELQADGRMTNQQLSDVIGLSPSPCLRRVKRLEAAGVIDRYVALVDPAALDLEVNAFVRVRLSQQDDRHLAIFEERIATFPEVMECYLMTGESDYQLRILARSLRAFGDFLRTKLTPIAGVSQLQSSFALRPVVYRTAIPIPAADG